jgi:phage recombination protein Bet
MAQDRNQMTHRAPAPISDLTLPAGVAEFGIDKPMWLALQNLYPGAQWQSQVMAYEYCKARGLDVLKKPVHIVPLYIEDKATGIKSMRDIIMPGITETRITAARTQEFAGQDEPKFGPMIEVPVTNAADAPANVNTLLAPEWVTVTVYRLVHGKRYGFSHTEYFLEAVGRTQKGLINAMWSKRPRGQLVKCALAGALRAGFPEEVGGEYTADEMIGQEVFADDLVPPAQNGASGIAEPGTKPAQQDDSLVVDAEFTEPAEEDDATGLVDPAVAAAATARVAEREAQEAALKKVAAKAKAKAAPPAESTPEPAAPPVDAKIDLPDGAKGILTRQMAIKGVTEAQLLAKLGGSVTIANINQALGLVKGWDA